MTSTEFVCKCGKQKAWIHEGKVTLPCPACGRRYEGKEKVDGRGVTVIYAQELVRV